MHRHRKTIIWATVLMVAAGALYAAVSLLGISIYRIDNGSMVPTLPVGTVVIDREGTPAKNDIVTFVNRDSASPEGITSHVFGGYTKDGHLRTRGVANPSEDNFTPAPTRSDVEGIVMFQIPIFASAFWLSLWGKVLAILTVLLVFVLWTESKPKSVTSHEVGPSTPSRPA